jgi:hypothetical protein
MRYIRIRNHRQDLSHRRILNREAEGIPSTSYLTLATHDKVSL